MATSYGYLDSRGKMDSGTSIATPESAKKRMTQEQLDLRARCVRLVVDLNYGCQTDARLVISDAKNLEQYLSGDE